MYDQWWYTIPANTAEADAIRVECKISPGILTDLFVFFPYGCHYYARCRIFIGGKPVAPRSAKHYLAAEGYCIELRRFNEPITGNLPVLNWHVWNLDDTEDHTLWLGAEWISEEETYERKMFLKLAEFVSLMRRLIGV